MYKSIAIDGPSGSGKSTIAKLLSEKLGFLYIDTGAMYRAMALYISKVEGNEDIEAKLEKYIDDIDISIKHEDGIQKIYLNGKDVSDCIRQEAIGNLASVISVYANVREKLVKLQRSIADKHNVVMDGRDIATTVLPNADVKIYLTAKPHTRALRRCKELTLKGINADISEIEQDIIKRDERDMNRELSPLRQSPDSYVVDSSDKDLSETLEEILFYVKRILNERC